MSFVLRDYQEQLKAEIYAAWASGFKNVLAVMPTGMGKTVTFGSITFDMINGTVTGQKFPTAIMVHRKELVAQISLTLAKVGIRHNIIATPKDISDIVAQQRIELGKSFYDYQADATVLSVDTLNSRYERHHKEWAKKIKLWIVDEAAHLLKTNKWGRCTSYFPHAIGLGVTATPERLDKKGLGRHADGVFDTMVFGPSTDYGIHSGHLCRYKVALPKSDYIDHLGDAKEGSDFTKAQMLKASGESHIVGDVVETYIKLANGKQNIVFADSIATAQRIEQGFISRGVSAKVLTGDTESNERSRAIRDFKERRIHVLINVDLFDEGLDVPGIEVVQMARPTMSLGKYLQMIGRGLRPAKGKDFLIVIDHVGNVQRHGLPDMRRRWTLDRIIKRRGTLSLIRLCQNIACNSPFDRVLTECPYCKTPFAVASRSGGESIREALEQVDGDLELLDPEKLQALFNNATLEDPGTLAQRVSKAAGAAAGLHALKNQQERIETQRQLSEVIAAWAGRQKYYGYSQRQIHKKYFLKFGQTITEALSEPRAEMLKTIEELENDW